MRSDQILGRKNAAVRPFLRTNQNALRIFVEESLVLGNQYARAAVVRAYTQYSAVRIDSARLSNCQIFRISCLVTCCFHSTPEFGVASALARHTSKARGKGGLPRQASQSKSELGIGCFVWSLEDRFLGWVTYRHESCGGLQGSR